jgi:hypothetical protein
MVKERGGTVVVECQPPLTKLLAQCPGVDRIFAAGEPLPIFGVHAPLLSLPRILNTTPETVPARIPYLVVDDGLRLEWRDRIRELVAKSAKLMSDRPVSFVGTAREPIARSPTRATSRLSRDLLIGVAWHGRGGEGVFRQRDIPLSFFLSLSNLPGVQLISLQKDGAEELDLATRQDIDASDPARALIYRIDDDIDSIRGAFVDTAAIMLNLDLVITSDTSIPHLAGALGVPVWLALPFVPDWRWLLDRSDSPWYPTMRLFRQKSPGAWPGVFEEIRRALELVAAKGQQ